ncbi:uncharacterized protein At3g27210-like [Carica papaya]|uniref:uncharacterized protein At3g27210-like n=1 Tax=Carica papaya TaxID=3649 RepID=UPI000B8D1A41|nr:uncharacterized protein At3g27210-like [Carica papaya]
MLKHINHLEMRLMRLMAYGLFQLFYQWRCLTIFAVLVTSYPDFTPSRGNTPVHQIISAGTPRINGTPINQSFSAATPKVNNATPGHQNSSITTPKINKPHFDGRPPGSTPEPSPTKKKLVELFRESIREDQDVDLPPKSAYVTPSVSGTNSFCSSERTANGDPLMEKDKPMKSVQCCLPSLVSCHSFSERKKKMSPAIAVNEKA